MKYDLKKFIRVVQAVALATGLYSAPAAIAEGQHKAGSSSFNELASAAVPYDLKSFAVRHGDASGHSKHEYDDDTRGTPFRQRGYSGSGTGSRFPSDAPPSPIPEPEIYAMLAAGLGLMGIVARRRTRSRSIRTQRRGEYPRAAGHILS